MDFFEQQDEARRRTKWLVVYFCLAVLCTILAIYAASALAFHLWVQDATRFNGGVGPFLNALYPFWDGLPFDFDLLLIISLATSAIITLGSGMKTFQLSGGGPSVAASLGGRRLRPDTTDPHERRLLNVVEEMAIASGMAVPPVYLMDEERSINAFAAGYRPSDAVVGVTRGTLLLLDRDELQGVVAHEFSHILNGDMRLNMRMTCLTHGILFIAQTGMFLLRLPWRMMHVVGSSSENNRRNGGFPFQIILLILIVGAALSLIGSIGYFFTKLLKSAVSRQREFLADAAAVQFTRNPGGIAGALKKIGGIARQGQIQAREAASASHFFFANSLAPSWIGMFSTHPPLEERIQRIDPQFDGKFPKVDDSPVRIDREMAETQARRKPPALPGVLTDASGAARVAGLIPGAGMISPAAIQAAASMAASVPPDLHRAVHEPFGARAVVYGLLLDPDPQVRSAQESVLRTQADPAVLVEFDRLTPAFADLDPRMRLVLLDLAIPALRELSAAQYQTFRSIVHALVAADHAVSLFEYCLEKILVRHLDPHIEGASRTTASGPSITSLAEVWSEVVALLGALAYLGSETYAEADTSFREGLAQLNIAGRQASLPAQEQAGLAEVDAALDRCARLTPMHKRNLLFACSQVVLKFRGLDSEEAELLRAIADTLECPLPPFVADAMLASLEV